MTEQESQQVRNNALLRYVYSKKKLRLANEALIQAADVFTDIGRVLRSPQRTTYVFDSQPWLNPDSLYRLIKEADEAQQDHFDAQERARSLGETFD